MVVPKELLDRLIEQARRYARWERFGDLVFLREIQEHQLLTGEALRKARRLREEQVGSKDD